MKKVSLLIVGKVIWTKSSEKYGKLTVLLDKTKDVEWVSNIAKVVGTIGGTRTDILQDGDQTGYETTEGSYLIKIKKGESFCAYDEKFEKVDLKDGDCIAITTCLYRYDYMGKSGVGAKAQDCLVLQRKEVEEKVPPQERYKQFLK